MNRFFKQNSYQGLLQSASHYRNWKDNKVKHDLEMRQRMVAKMDAENQRQLSSMGVNVPEQASWTN